MELRKVEINNVKNSAQQPSYPWFTIVLSRIGSHTGGNPKSPIIYPDDNSTYLDTFNIMI